MNKNKNLLQINTGNTGGGAEQIASTIHYFLRKHGWKTSMIVGNKQSNDPTVVEMKSPRILTYFNLLFGLEYVFYMNTFFIKNWKIFKEAKIVHYHNLHGYYFNLLAFSAMSKLKTSVWTFHDMWPILGHAAHSFDCKKCESGLRCSEHKNTYPKLYTIDTSPILYKLKKMILTKSDFTIVVPSLWLKRKVEQSFLKNKRIYLIHNGVDTDIFKSYPKEKIRKELGLPRNKKIITFVASGGLTNEWKGIKYAFDIIKRFSQDKEVMFLSIGGINEEMKVFSNLKQIKFVSDKKQLAKYYNASDIFLLTSLAENLPLTVLESMSCGLPVVSFNVGGIKEIIDHLANGYIAKYKDVNDLIRGVDYVLNLNNKKTNEMKYRSRLKVVSNFTVDKMVNQYEKLYNLLGTKYNA